MKLTRESGWSFDECERWIEATLWTLVVQGGEPAPSSAGPPEPTPS